MSTTQAHIIYDQDDTGARTDRVVAYIKPASAESVVTVLDAGADNDDGRSDWVWVRLISGELILGVFPQGDTYFATEEDHS